jgi:CheY-like chemotaxis protein
MPNPDMKAANGRAVATRPAWTVLVADDDPDIVRALSIGCRKLGLDVQTVENGLAAIQSAADAPPDLLIVDIGMPDLDGYEVCDRLLEMSVIFPVIALTGRTDSETLSRCQALGVHHVAKDGYFWERLQRLMFMLLEGYWPDALRSKPDARIGPRGVPHDGGST